MLGGMNVQQQKERILSLIQTRGPSLPVQIARGISVSLLFAGAFLSELYADRKVKMSSLRVGSSPLYYIEGQGNLLENFIQYLNVREREAFLLLKKEGILDDEAQTPVMRVALRAIKDFAIPVKVKMNEQEKFFWRHFLVQESELRELMRPRFFDLEKKEEIQREIPEVEKKVLLEVVKKEEVLKEGKKIEEEKIEKEVEVKKEKEKKIGEEKDKSEVKNIKKSVRKEKKVESSFVRKIKEYLDAKNIEVLESVLEKKKEFIGRVRIDMVFGKQEFLLIAKDKKTISDNDLAIALQNAQAGRMPALILAPAEMNKKAQEYLREWRNLVKFERVKI